MGSPRWRKVLRDIWGSKTRTILVVLSIAVGVFAVGMIAGSQAILSRDLKDGYMAVNPAHASLATEAFDDDLVQVIRGMPEVADAEGRRSVRMRVRIGPDEWRSLELFAIPDYEDVRINKVFPEQGAWPPPDRGILIERASLGLTNANVGDMVVIETPSGKQRQLTIAGLTHDINLPPAVFVGNAYGYITFDTLEWLGEPRDFDTLNITVAENPDDEDHIQTVANLVRDKVEKGGRTVYFIWIPTPGEHPANDAVQPMLLILGVLGFLSLLLSGFLVVNTIGALLTQQIRQIGVMKTIGGRTSQISAMYFGTVLILSVLSLLVAVPLGAIAARAFTDFMAGLINFDVVSYGVPPQVLALEVGAGLVVPLLAALWPIVAGTRITVLEALSAYGIGKGRFGKGMLDRLLERVRGVSRPMLLSLRNTFRRKGRLALTLSTLTLGGAIFIAVFSVRDSLLLTLDDAFKYWNYDIEVDFNRAYDIGQLEREATNVPGVVRAESWGGASMRRQRPNETESDNIFMVALPATTNLLQPTLLEGRWLLPADENAIVINTDLLKDETDLQVGDEVVFKREGRESTWRIVGIVRGVLTGPIAYANYPYFSRELRTANRSGDLRIVTAQRDAAYQMQVAQALEAHFESLGMRVGGTSTIASVQERIKFQFDLIVVFLLIMALLLAVVGGLGLMGTMSINVLERTREIGVMRAIGASNRAVLQIVMVEGMLIGALSWCIGALAAIPLSQLMSNTVGMAFLRAPLSYTFSTSGLLIWLIVVIVLAALASILPAWNASRLTVREVLAYE